MGKTLICRVAPLSEASDYICDVDGAESLPRLRLFHHELRSPVDLRVIAPALSSGKFNGSRRLRNF